MKDIVSNNWFITIYGGMLCLLIGDMIFDKKRRVLASIFFVVLSMLLVTFILIPSPKSKVALNQNQQYGTSTTTQTSKTTSLIYNLTSTQQIQLATNNTTTTNLSSTQNIPVLTITPTTATTTATTSTTTTPTTTTTPIITSVSKISATQTQSITIKGQGFGALSPYNGDSAYIDITDVTWGWDAGYNSDYLGQTNAIKLNISQWTDGEIIISGFSGTYGQTYSLNVGDKISISIWNVPSGTGPASYQIVCGAPTNATSATPVITSVSKISATQTQNITIEGQGFGALDPYNGDSAYIDITDVTSGWNAGYNNGTWVDSNAVTLKIAQWTDGQILISGFSGSYRPAVSLNIGDTILIRIWNVPSGAGPASYQIVCGAG